MEVRRSKTFIISWTQSNREYSIIPLITQTSHIEITEDRIEAEVIVREAPNAIATKTVDIQTEVGQIGKVRKGIVTFGALNINRYTGESIASCCDAFGNLESSNQFVSVQIVNIDGRALYLSKVIWKARELDGLWRPSTSQRSLTSIFQNTSVDEPQSIAFINGCPIDGNNSILVRLKLWLKFIK